MMPSKALSIWPDVPRYLCKKISELVYFGIGCLSVHAKKQIFTI